MTMPTNGTLKAWVLGIAASICGALAVASLLGLVSLRDRVGGLESAWGVPGGAMGMVALQERVTRIEGQLAALEQWRGEGHRFTKADGEQLKADLERQISRLEGDLTDFRRGRH